MMRSNNILSNILCYIIKMYIYPFAHLSLKHPQISSKRRLLFGFRFFGTCFSCRQNALHDFQKSHPPRKSCRSCSRLPTYEGN